MNHKKDFPIFKNQPELVYLDSAATSQKPQQVIDAIIDFYSRYNANAHRGIYQIAEEATESVETVRKKVQHFIHARFPEEIIFVKNTTEAINLVAYAYGDKNIQEGDVIAVPASEHHSNFVPWQQLAKRRQAKIQILDIDENGKTVTQVKNAKLITLSLVSHMLGTIANGKLVRKIKKQNNIVVVDAAQAVPHLQVDVQDLDCDFLAFSGHKMLAETGIGVLYIKKELHEKVDPFLFGGHMIDTVSVNETTFSHSPSKYEAGTLNISGIISLGAAIDYLQNIGLDKIHEHEKKLSQLCIEQLQKIDGVTIYGPKQTSQRSGVVSFTIDGIHSHDVAQILGDEKICIRAGHHCAMPLHTRLGIPSSARASFYLYNTEGDVEKLIEGIQKVKKTFKV